jgi:tripartite-type tricarboxylate transporter receptor subunit TctC
MITKRHLLPRAALCIASIAAAASWNGLAAGHDAVSAYPTKPLRLILAFTPGGPADATGRPVAQGLTEAWGQQVIVDHRPGAGGNIAAEITAKAPPDG